MTNYYSLTPFYRINMLITLYNSIFSFFAKILKKIFFTKKEGNWQIFNGSWQKALKKCNKGYEDELLTGNLPQKLNPMRHAVILNLIKVFNEKGRKPLTVLDIGGGIGDLYLTALDFFSKNDLNWNIHETKAVAHFAKKNGLDKDIKFPNVPLKDKFLLFFNNLNCIVDFIRNQLKKNVYYKKYSQGIFRVICSIYCYCIISQAGSLRANSFRSFKTRFRGHYA